jgi:hypothetical protein
VYVYVCVINACFLLLSVSASLSLSLSAHKFPQPPPSNRTTFHVVGKVPFRNFDLIYGPAFSDFLNQQVGSQYDPPITFTIRQAPGVEAYTLEPFVDPLGTQFTSFSSKKVQILTRDRAPVANMLDFVFTTPNMASCLEQEFAFTPGSASEYTTRLG